MNTAQILIFFKYKNEKNPVLNTARYVSAAARPPRPAAAPCIQAYSIPRGRSVGRRLAGDGEVFRCRSDADTNSYPAHQTTNKWKAASWFDAHGARARIPGSGNLVTLHLAPSCHQQGPSRAMPAGTSGSGHKLVSYTKYTQTYHEESQR